jgi:hypothetical protein
VHAARNRALLASAITLSVEGRLGTFWAHFDSNEGNFRELQSMLFCRSERVRPFDQHPEPGSIPGSSTREYAGQDHKSWPISFLVNSSSASCCPGLVRALPGSPARALAVMAVTLLWALTGVSRRSRAWSPTRAQWTYVTGALCRGRPATLGIA